jgi:hypothetical protein
LILVSGKARASLNRRHSALCRGLKTSENAAGGRKMPFMDEHELIEKIN